MVVSSAKDQILNVWLANISHVLVSYIKLPQLVFYRVHIVLTIIIPGGPKNFRTLNVTCMSIYLVNFF